METIAEKEALACLRVLVAIARADGTIHQDERKSLSAALESLELPGGVTVDTLLAEKPDLDEQLALVTSTEAREQLYRSAHFMAHADGACTKEEQALIDRIGEATGVDRSSLAGIFVGNGGGADEGRGSILDVPAAIPDPVARASRSRSPSQAVGHHAEVGVMMLKCVWVQHRHPSPRATLCAPRQCCAVEPVW
jgi:uncharacterized tellurite resistance protein B-like protein